MKRAAYATFVTSIKAPKPLHTPIGADFKPTTWQIGDLLFTDDVVAASSKALQSAQDFLLQPQAAAHANRLGILQLSTEFSVAYI